MKSSILFAFASPFLSASLLPAAAVVPVTTASPVGVSEEGQTLVSSLFFTDADMTRPAVAVSSDEAAQSDTLAKKKKKKKKKGGGS